MTGIVVSGFPGIGKTKLSEIQELRVSDSDSSKFDKSAFPANYIEHIKEQRKTQDIVLVSSHDTVRQAMNDAGIHYILVYPNIKLMGEYIQRYTDRGNKKAFIDLVYANWDDWITGCAKQQNCHRLELQQRQYLTDALPTILQAIQRGHSCIG